ncbi:MAG TPA: transglutaminase-like domain-containing protein [Phycisphaerae bacterium]|nr:transglutaminase-like domain-containing protein [Phycisphaerae bacterium]
MATCSQPRPDFTARLLLILVVATSAVAADYAAISQDHSKWLLSIANASALSACLAVHLLFPKRPRLSQLLLLLCMVSPFIVQLLSPFIGLRHPWELVLLTAVRNLAIWFALGKPIAHQRASALLAICVLIFASCIETTHTMAMFVAFAALGAGLWLLRQYWAALPPMLRRASSAKYPYLRVIALYVLIAIIIACVFLQQPAASHALAGFFPSSGGSFDADPNATGGLNDAGGSVLDSQTPSGTGFSKNASSMDSNKPCLYDIFTESYGKPIRPDDNGKTISLNQSATNLKRQKAGGDALDMAREFDIRRTLSTPPSRFRNQRASALFYYRGPSRHLRTGVYDVFAENIWTRSPGAAAYRPILRIDDRSTWMAPGFAPPMHPLSRLYSHEISTGLLDSAEIPSPAAITRFRIGLVGDPTFFALPADHVLRLAKRTVPGGTVTELTSILDDATAVGATPLATAASAPESIPPRITELAHRWTSTAPPGWPQVHAVLTHLQEEFSLDRHAPIATPAVLDDFLDRKAGPDYLFASTAALSLRSLGFHAHLVTGFYVDESQYDYLSRRTPVRAADVHTWLEVQLADGSWTELEPTPGYCLPGQPLTWSDRWHNASQFVLATLRAHAAMTFTGIAMLALIWRCWPPILDAALSTFLWTRSGGNSRRDAQRLLALIEWRARIAGLSRPAAISAARWYARLLPDSPNHSSELLTWCEWAQFSAPDAPSPVPRHTAIALRTFAIRRCTRAQLRDAHRFYQGNTA